MEWRGRRGTGKIEDRRGMGARGASGLGIVGTLVVLAVGYFFGVDVSPLVSGLEGATQSGESRPLSRDEEQMGQFVSVVLGETDQVYGTQMAQAGLQYRQPTLVLFSGVTQSACGGASAQTGPFYCPADRKIYLDTQFFDLMERKMQAGGDFAAAYVIAHEAAHHLQNELGILPEVNRLRARASERQSNELSVLTELQADCFSGMWARHAQERLNVTHEDLNEAINAARAVGDDVMQQRAGRAVMPDAFTHGSAADRQAWFARGYDGGTLQSCNSFAEAGI